MFEIIASLIGLGVLFVIGLGGLVLVRKLLGHSNLIPSLSSNLNADSSNEKVTESEFKRKLPIVLKGVGIGVLAIISLSVLGLLEGITDERGRLYSNVTDEIGDTWGNSQTISGPVLVIPFSYQTVETKTYKLNSGEDKTKRTHRTIYDKMVILPEQLNLNINLDYDFRYRGIYQAMVYNAVLDGEANFPKHDFTTGNYKDYSRLKINYQDSYLSFGVSDNKAIQKVSKFTMDDKTLKLNSGTNLTNTGIEQGFHSPVDIKVASEKFQVKFAIDFRGSRSIAVLPLAEDSNLQISSNWQHPSFHGMLPNTRELSENGFVARWELSHLARNYPQSFRASQQPSVTEVSAETMLFEPVTHYSKVKRSVKYGILFICLTFLALYVFDLKKKVNFSLIQYCLVGASLSIFYLLLLSLSEHLGFLAAYIVASLVAVLSIASYVGFAAKSIKSATLMVGLLVSLYSVLYSILQLEQFALLTGSLFLVLIIFALMYATRHMARPQLNVEE